MRSEPPASDARRANGERTRRRLLDATRALLAERGEDDVTLREIVARAEANVAAVSYHFGSKERLCDAAIDEALRAVVEVQLERYRALPRRAGIDELALAFAEPVFVSAATGDEETRALMRILGRVMGDPGPRGRAAHAATLALGTDVLKGRLRQLDPTADDEALDVRVAGAGAILQAYSLDGLGTRLVGRPPAEVERLLLGVIAGALAGGATTAP